MARGQAFRASKFGPRRLGFNGHRDFRRKSRQAQFRREAAFERRFPRPIIVPGFTRTSGFFGRFAQGGELKFHDVDIDLSPIPAAGSVNDSQVKIPQGTTEKTRIGRKATVRSINWRFQIRLLAAANATGGDVVRVIMYVDKQCNGATANVTDILESADYQSFNNLGNKNRFRTLMDRTYDLNPMSAAGDGTANDALPFAINDTFFKKVNLPIEWNSTAGAITEIQSNNIGILLISRANTLSDFESKVRIRFSDN